MVEALDVGAPVVVSHPPQRLKAEWRTLWDSRAFALQALGGLVHQGDWHEDRDCPQDDTCECKLAALIGAVFRGESPEWIRQMLDGEDMQPVRNGYTQDALEAANERAEKAEARERELTRLMEVSELALRRGVLPDGDGDVCGWVRRKLAQALVAGGDQRRDLLTPASSERDHRPTPTCEDCATLGEMCAGCEMLVYGMPEEKEASVPCGSRSFLRDECGLPAGHDGKHTAFRPRSTRKWSDDGDVEITPNWCSEPPDA